MRELNKVYEIKEKDNYDKRWGHWLEYGLETIEEYYKLKDFVIKTGQLSEFVVVENGNQ
ncbi:MAG: hypothetical protein HC892_14475 [Saprospiraceae bacterium]|nr:hypothetical protein [Saprospiraceae bacterium]